MRYDKEKRYFMTKKLIELKSPTLVQRAYRTKYNGSTCPARKTILDLARNFEKFGTLLDLPPKPKNQRASRVDALNQPKILFAEDPSLSLNKASIAVGISASLCRDILRKDLQLKPFKYQSSHELLPPDYAKRVNFAQWWQGLPKDAQLWLIASDEAYFYLTEAINKQNNRLWLTERPGDWIEKPLHDAKVLVWCAITSRKVYGPYFFEESVNQHNYLHMLKTFFWPKHYRLKDAKKYYFQQDGATPHTANLVQDYLKDKFGDQFIGKKQWPPRSPDLNPCDYFLWGYLKSKVYKPLPYTLDQLKANITREIRNINNSVLNSTFFNFSKRCDLIIEKNGGHIENK